MESQSSVTNKRETVFPFEERELYIFTLAFLLSVSLAVVCAALVAQWVYLSTDFDYAEAMRQYPVYREELLHEPWEMAWYVSLWISFALFFAVIYHALEKRAGDVLGKIRHAAFLPAVALLITTGALYALFFAEPDFFFVRMTWFRWPVAALPLILCSAILYRRKSRVFPFLQIAVILLAAVMCYVPNPLFGINIFHTNCFFTTIYNVYYGASLGVETIPVYGTYAYLFAPLFKVTGLTMEAYAAFICALCVVCMLCWHYVISKLIQNPFLRFCTLSVCIYLDVYFAIDAHLEQFISQHFPYRIVFPSLMLAYLTWGASHGLLQKRLYAWGGTDLYSRFHQQSGERPDYGNGFPLFLFHRGDQIIFAR